jgi:Helix-turn-helix domain/Aminoacyl-tRNA editing domain
VKTRDGYLRVVLQGSGRLDLRKLRALLDGNKHDVRLASEDDLGRDFPEFELGAVPPVGGDRRDSVVVDSRVAEREALVFEAGSHEESARLGPTTSSGSLPRRSRTSAKARPWRTGASRATLSVPPSGVHVFEIGSSLREARMRESLELADVERATRIRARYLMALEEERFDIFPGTAYAKGFLRTYADHLGLDAQRFVDEYARPSRRPPSRRSASSPHAGRAGSTST